VYEAMGCTVRRKIRIPFSLQSDAEESQPSLNICRVGSENVYYTTYKYVIILGLLTAFDKATQQIVL